MISGILYYAFEIIKEQFHVYLCIVQLVLADVEFIKWLISNAVIFSKIN